jgi:Tol biopolymer transport system component
MTETQKAQPVEVRRRGQPVPRTYLTAMAALLVLAWAGRGTVVETWPGTHSTVTSKPDTAAPAELNTVNARSNDPVDFARLHGWIAYGTKEGIWAVDPKRPNHNLQLSDQAGDPLSWSRHASKLLIARQTDPQTWPGDLFVLKADGSETRLTDLRRHPWLSGGSFSPDGSQVVYSTIFGHRWHSVVWLIDADGGTPQRLFRRKRDIAHPVFSPNGEKIAFVAGGGDHSNTFMVMNADGGHARVVLSPDRLQGASHVNHLAWSPDGTRLAFDADRPGDGVWRMEIYTFNSDGTGLTLIRPGRNPDWSPEGSRIAFVHHGVLYTMAADGTDKQKVRRVGLEVPIAWNRSRDA